MAVNVTGRPLLDGLSLDVNVVVVPALFTVCESAEDVLLVWVASPLYWAVMECDPTERVGVERVATPLASRTDVPSVEAPSMNVTVPVAPEDGFAVAANVTGCPYTEGLSEDVNMVVVMIVLADTVCVREGDVLPVKLALPL